MELEQQQAEHIERILKEANEGASLSHVITIATSRPCLFAFSEILSLPALTELQETERSACLDLLRLFAYGTWSDYKSNAGNLPQLVPDQVLKLKQLTLLTLAETNKVLSYDLLMEELDVANVRELEDFLINEGMYAGIVRGKLDQLRGRFEIQYAAGRDPRPDQLGNMIQTITDWLTTSDNLLISIKEKMKWAESMNELNKQHKKEVEERLEDAKRKCVNVKKSHTTSRRGALH